ncbi:MAG TPA: hypothetical protein VGO66_02255, partial [Solirubrobacterales bacterium]|nr:hypothetical protein [Solirubrobacterales bacterium]
MILAACGEGGSDAVAWLLTLGVFAICLAVAVLIVRGLGRDRTERRFLAGLLVATFVLGPLIIAAFYAGTF